MRQQPSATADSAAPATFTRTYPATPAHVGDVRADLRSMLCGCPLADEIILCASELAANAATHSLSAAPDGTMTITAQLGPAAWARIEVQDDGGPWAPRRADADRPHGLDIIAALATAWGADDGGTGRAVWACFDWPAS